MPDDDTILLDHGSGGRLTHELISRLVLPRFANPALEPLDDGARLDLGDVRLAFSTDSFVVDPPFFPGGDIGELAVNGTVNDLAMCGAEPLWLSLGLIIQEGFGRRELERVLDSAAAAARKAGVTVVTGDTKVVPRGAADRIFINTSGIGRIPAGLNVSGANARPGDRVLLSGTIADHGMAVLTAREHLVVDAPLRSDTAALNGLTRRILAACPKTRVLRDPTRGGVATTLNEIARASGVGIRLDETAIPVHPAVRGVCDLLGFDPLYVANEGKLLAVVPPGAAETVLAVMRTDPLGTAAALIGEIGADHPGQVVLHTAVGGRRLVDMLAGEQLPRIC